MSYSYRVNNYTRRRLTGRRTTRYSRRLSYRGGRRVRRYGSRRTGSVWGSGNRMNSRGAIVQKYKRLVTVNNPPAGAGQITGLAINMNGNETSSNPQTSVLAYYIDAGSNTNITGATVGQHVLPGNVYDQNRCSGVKIEWFPARPNGSINGQYQPMAVLWDNDGIEGDWSSINVNQAMEQTDSVKVFNAYMPWSLYIKAPKQDVNTTTATVRPQRRENDDGPPGGNWPANSNLAGQWKQAANHLVSSCFTNDTSNLSAVFGRGVHILCILDGIVMDSNITLGGPLGRFVVTTYYTYKDKK